MRGAYLQLALAMSLVGTNIAVGKIIVKEVPVFLFSEMRFFIASFFLIPLLFCGRQEKIQLQKNGWGFLFLQSFFGVFLFSILMLYGVKFTSATSAGIITSTIPAAIAILSYFLLQEKPSIMQCISVCFAVLGISIISFQGDSMEKDGMLGNILIIGAVISEALFTIYAKKLSGILTPLQMAVGVNSFGIILFFPFAIIEGLTFDFNSINVSMWLIIAYYSITASVLSFILWYCGVEKVNANVAGLFTGFMPIAATFVSVICLKEDFGLVHLVGMVCVLSAIYLGTKGSLNHDIKRGSA